MNQQRLVLAAVGAVVLLALGLFVWALRPAPAPFVPPPPPTRVESTPRPTPRPLRMRPPPVEVPDGAIDEALTAVAAANEAYRVRCSVPSDIEARGVPLRYATWVDNEVTMVVASSSGRVPLRDLYALPGKQTAGAVAWEDVALGSTGACRFEPAKQVQIEVVLTGLQDDQSYKLFVCDERNKVDVVDGRATLELPAHEVCMLRVHRVDEFHMPQLFTSSGNMIPLRPTDDTTLELEVVDKDALSQDALDAINEVTAADAAAFMGVPARPRIDLDATLANEGLSPEARAWLEQQRR